MLSTQYSKSTATSVGWDQSVSIVMKFDNYRQRDGTFFQKGKTTFEGDTAVRQKAVQRYSTSFLFVARRYLEFLSFLSFAIV